MKQKNHSGLKKRLKIRKSGKLMLQKSAKRHLLINKTKKQKKASKYGLPVHYTKVQDIRRLMPGKVKLKKNLKGPKSVKKVVKKAEKKEA